MKARLYISSQEVSLDFDKTEDRDLFFENLGQNKSLGFSPQDACEKVGPLTIIITPSSFDMGYVWNVEF